MQSFPADHRRAVLTTFSPVPKSLRALRLPRKTDPVIFSPPVPSNPSSRLVRQSPIEWPTGSDPLISSLAAFECRSPAASRPCSLAERSAWRPATYPLVKFSLDISASEINGQNRPISRLGLAVDVRCRTATRSSGMVSMRQASPGLRHAVQAGTIATTATRPMPSQKAAP